MYSPQCGSSSFNGDYMDGFYRPDEEPDKIFRVFQHGYSSDEEEREEIYENLRTLYGTQPSNRREMSKPPEGSRPASPMNIREPTPMSDDEFLKIIEYAEKSSSKSIESSTQSTISRSEICSPESNLENIPWEPTDNPPRTLDPIPEKPPFNYEAPKPGNGMFTPTMHSPLPPSHTNQPATDCYNNYHNAPASSTYSWDGYDQFQNQNSFQFTAAFGAAPSYPTSRTKSRYTHLRGNEKRRSSTAIELNRTSFYFSVVHYLLPPA
ncbi:hypothetical protein GCK72_023615 [Caenorhabditis remanei]|uniref:Uncharacterized protein n=1 Tax=Caenorhabditis remanei TaxID=31234 RepID=A0A6A5FXE8_CAERE|nr:hypothetical protein GCK72_023615 [Caenorhabditis remanei]KAF1747154.1 hypothetical protein GCK72_023615 [Caenorhabditis remanei]